MILVSLTPNGLRLRLYTALCTKNRNTAVEYTQRTLNLYGEVNVSRCINDVDSVVLPLCSGSGRGNRNTTFLLLLHPVHLCGALVGLTDLMDTACIEQDTLRGSRLTGINVRHDTYISGFLQ